MMLEGSSWKFRDPAILIVPSLSVHAFAYEEQADGWVVTVAKSYFQEITARAPEFSEIFNVGGCVEFLHQEAAYLELERVIAKLEWEQRRSARCREIATEALLIDLLVGVLRKLQVTESPQLAESGSYQDAYRRFIGMVEEHHREHWSLQRFAEGAGYQRAAAARRLPHGLRRIADPHHQSAHRPRSQALPHLHEHERFRDCLPARLRRPVLLLALLQVAL